jgi:L-amino acid N-acyltransferase YncA
VKVLPGRFLVREAVPADAAPLCEILNSIIEIGGTTALETPLTAAEFSEMYLDGERCLGCFVAAASDAEVLLGFQALSRHAKLPENWADIATFARMEPKSPGVGTALFARTMQRARELEAAAINATIRADNTGGLAYYEKMGFQTYQVAKGVLLQDGTPVDRIFKRYVVGQSLQPAR